MDEDAPPYLRWRIVSWAIAAVILLPVLYVAAAGPIRWWVEYHRSPWYRVYYDSFNPLYSRSPKLYSIIEAYWGWWEKLPAPRAWRRQKLVDELADRRQLRERTLAELAQLTAEAAPLKPRFDALKSQADLAEDERTEMTLLRRRLIAISWKLGHEGKLPAVLSPRALMLDSMDAHIQKAEDELRQFDAQ